MYFNFMTDTFEEAVGALLVYATWRSRDIKKMKITPDIWGYVERSVKSVAKRAMDLDCFLENLKPKLHCPTIKPAFSQTILDIPVEMIALGDGSFVKREEQGRRRFLVDVLAEVDHQTVLANLYRKTSKIILLVRDRCERERPLEGTFQKLNDDTDFEEAKEKIKEAVLNAKSR